MLKHLLPFLAPKPSGKSGLYTNAFCEEFVKIKRKGQLSSLGQYSVERSFQYKDHGEIIRNLNNLSLEEADNWRLGDHKSQSSWPICRNLDESVGFPTVLALGLRQSYLHFKGKADPSWHLDHLKKNFLMTGLFSP